MDSREQFFDSRSQASLLALVGFHGLRRLRSMLFACVETARRGCGATSAAVAHSRPTGVKPIRAGATAASADAGNAWSHVTFGMRRHCSMRDHLP